MNKTIKMLQTILGFEIDEEYHYVALLSCGHRHICAELRVKALENINKFVMMVWQILTSYCEYLPTTIIKSQS
ncbi:hypothetical protein [Acinetobacter bereziniae]|uniref:hypothetical protein n=1 Tax=Acinetobacter bereziniae TaxID=106648 RepID=UPI001D171A0F|nr:hypothetical protein [Acinetobacter bereziniae]MDP6002452.1 hypothetical protein [Acinetobacter bereziniae]